MYLHIGNNYLLPRRDVIAIFNVPALEADPKGRRYVERVRRAENTVDVSDGKWISLVLAGETVYVSRISSSTLLGRSMEPLETIMERTAARERTGRDASAGEPGSGEDADELEEREARRTLEEEETEPKL